MVGDLTTYLHANNLLRYIEGYVQKVAPQKAPAVVGALLDCEAPDEFINNLILSVRSGDDFLTLLIRCFYCDRSACSLFCAQDSSTSTTQSWNHSSSLQYLTRQMCHYILLPQVRSLLPVGELCEAVEARGRLKLLTPFLEHLIAEGSQARPLAVNMCCLSF